MRKNLQKREKFLSSTQEVLYQKEFKQANNIYKQTQAMNIHAYVYTSLSTTYEAVVDNSFNPCAGKFSYPQILCG
ncbi:MAG TPA: YfhE family protein [Bacillota bacterium]|nr:YfhE family protein [Bacillota bacterium]